MSHVIVAIAAFLAGIFWPYLYEFIRLMANRVWKYLNVVTYVPPKE